MKQRIRTVGIIRKDDGVLFLKRNLERNDGELVWELPAGKICFGEQPEEAMTRVIYEEVGVRAVAIKLVDVVTFLALGGGSSQLSNLYIIYEITISDEEKIKLGDKYSAYKFLDNEEKNSVRMDDASLSILGMLYDESDGLEQKNNYKKALNGATVFVDGCSRGNPGPSGAGYYIVGDDGRELERGGIFVGFATSRVAEYYALKEGCQRAIELGLKSVKFVGDNLMMINQMNGIYKVKNDDILPIYGDVKKLLGRFEAYAFIHVKRERNMIADEEANRAVDRHFA